MKYTASMIHAVKNIMYDDLRHDPDIAKLNSYEFATFADNPTADLNVNRLASLSSILDRPYHQVPKILMTYDPHNFCGTAPNITSYTTDRWAESCAKIYKMEALAAYFIDKLCLEIGRDFSCAIPYARFETIIPYEASVNGLVEVEYRIAIRDLRPGNNDIVLVTIKFRPFVKINFSFTQLKYTMTINNEYYDGKVGPELVNKLKSSKYIQALK